EAEGLEDIEIEGTEIEAEDAPFEAEDFEEDLDHEGEGDREAEVRAPAGTAAFQQKTERAERGGKRFGRGRRGRVRPGGGGGGGPRRNIQHEPSPTISELLKEGQEILVQIAKEPIAKKG